MSASDVRKTHRGELSTLRIELDGNSQRRLIELQHHLHHAKSSERQVKIDDEAAVHINHLNADGYSHQLNQARARERKPVRDADTGRAENADGSCGCRN